MSQYKVLKIILIVVILVAIFWGSKTVENYFQDIIDYIADYTGDEKWKGAAIFGITTILSVMLVSFSSIWLVPIAASLWGNLFTLAILTVGWLLGSIFSYLIGKYAGYRIVRKIIPEEKINKYSDIISQARKSFNLIILSRFVLPSEIPGYLLGIAKYPFPKYLIATVISEIPYAFVTVYFIDAILRKNVVAFLIWGAIWIILALIMIRTYRQIINN